METEHLPAAQRLAANERVHPYLAQILRRAGTAAGNVPDECHLGYHFGILPNFVDGAQLMAPGEERIHSVELANASLLSARTDPEADLPLDDTLTSAQWRKLVTSRSKASPAAEVIVDFPKSVS